MHTPTVDSVWLKENGHLTLGSTIDDWRTVLSVGRDYALGFSATRVVEIPNQCNMVLFKGWAESGVAPTWRIGAWRYSSFGDQWTCFQVGVVTITAGASSGGTVLRQDRGTTMYSPLTHTVLVNDKWMKFADGDATYKAPGIIMFDPCGARRITFSPYHASATTKVNGQVSWW